MAATRRCPPPVAHEQRRRVVHGDEAGLRHAEDADLVYAPEAILGRAQDAVIGDRLALEVEHRVDDVLERLGAGDPASLGDMTDDEHRGAGLLGEAHEPGGTLADLADVTGCALEIRGEDGLNGVEDDGSRSQGLGGRENVLEVRLAEQHDVARAFLQAIGTQLDLERGFLARHVECRSARRLQSRGHLEQQGGLPGPRLTAQEHHGAGHHSAAEHEVELAKSGAPPLFLGSRDVAESCGHDSGTDLAAAASLAEATLVCGGRDGRGRHLLHEAVPFPATVAAPAPPRVLGAAFSTAIDGLSLCHDEKMPTSRTCRLANSE